MKISEAFEGPNSSLRKTFDNVPMPTQPTDERVEKVAEQLHEWYLEATNQDGAKYNHEAVVPYGDLPEGSKLLDRYIASKIITTLFADCEARVRGEAYKFVADYKNKYRGCGMADSMLALDELLEALTPPN